MSEMATFCGAIGGEWVAAVELKRVHMALLLVGDSWGSNEHVVLDVGVGETDKGIQFAMTTPGFAWGATASSFACMQRSDQSVVWCCGREPNGGGIVRCVVGRGGSAPAGWRAHKMAPSKAATLSPS
jgi:hypothetical protein